MYKKSNKEIKKDNLKKVYPIFTFLLLTLGLFVSIFVLKKIEHQRIETAKDKIAQEAKKVDSEIEEIKEKQVSDKDVADAQTKKEEVNKTVTEKEKEIEELKKKKEELESKVNE